VVHVAGAAGCRVPVGRVRGGVGAAGKSPAEATAESLE